MNDWDMLAITKLMKTKSVIDKAVDEIRKI